MTSPVPTALHVIDGQTVPSASGRTFDSVEPATGKSFASVSFGEDVDVDRAVTSAAAAYDDGRWAGLAPAERARRMRRIAELLIENVEQLAELEARDSGAPLARGDVSAAAELFHYFALTTGEFARICLEAGIPPGVLNVVHGDGAVTGAALVRHPLVRKITFTGSTEVGRQILREAAEHIKSVHLELGGKTPSVVFADANLDEAVEGSLFTTYFNSGQVCTSRSMRMADRLEAGIVWTNCPNYGQWNVPYEGHKQSGLGEDKGLECVETFTQLKVHQVNFGGYRSPWAQTK